MIAASILEYMFITVTCCGEITEKLCCCFDEGRSDRYLDGRQTRTHTHTHRPDRVHYPYH